MTPRSWLRLGIFAATAAAAACGDGDAEVLQSPDSGSDASSGGSGGASGGTGGAATGGAAGGSAGTPSTGGGAGTPGTGGAAGTPGIGGAAGLPGIGGAAGAPAACDLTPNSCVPPNATCPSGTQESTKLGCSKKNHKCCLAGGSDAGTCKPSGAPCTKNEECCTPVCLPTGCWAEF